MEYSWHVWAVAAKCYLDLLEKLQSCICNVVGPELSACLQSLPRSWDVARYYWYCFGGCSSELFELVPFPHACGISTRYSNRLQDFVITVAGCSKKVYANSFFPCIVKLWNSLFGECFPLAYNLNRFKVNVNRDLMSLS